MPLYVAAAYLCLWWLPHAGREWVALLREWHDYRAERSRQTDPPIMLSVSDTTAIAIAGIVVSGVVGPSTIALWASHRQKRDHQHELGKEVRELLDDAAAALGKMRRATMRIVRLWERGLPDSDARVREETAAQREAVEQSRYARDRLRLRLGKDHPVTEAYEEAALVLDEIYGIVSGRAGREPIDQYRERINEQGRRFTDRSDAFLAEAKAFIGPIV